MKALLLLFALTVFPSASFAGEVLVSAKIELSLHESLLATLDNNFDIAIEKEQPSIANNEAEIKKSDFDPTLFGTAEQTTSKTPSASAFANPKIRQEREEKLTLGVKQKLSLGTEYALSLESRKNKTNSTFTTLNPEFNSAVKLEVTQPLLKGLGKSINKTAIVVAENKIKMSREQFTYKVMSVLTDTRIAYWQTVYLTRELEVQKESLARAKDFLKRVETQVEVGVLAPIEIISAKAFVAEKREGLITVHEAIGNNQDRLKALLNLPSAMPGDTNEITPIDTPEVRAVTADKEALLEGAFKSRPDYLQAKLELKNRIQEEKFYNNQLLPKVNITGSISYKGLRGTSSPSSSLFTGTADSSFTGTAGESITDIGKRKYYDYNIGVTAEYPLFNRQGKNRAGKALMIRNNSKTKLKRLKQTIEVELYRSIRAVKTALQRISATKASKELMLEKLDAETSKYEVGSSTAFAVLEFQKDLTQAESNEIKAITDYIIAVARLDMASGQVLKKNNIVLEFSGQ